MKYTRRQVLGHLLSGVCVALPAGKLYAGVTSSNKEVIDILCPPESKPVSTNKDFYSILREGKNIQLISNDQFCESIFESSNNKLVLFIANNMGPCEYGSAMVLRDISKRDFVDCYVHESGGDNSLTNSLKVYPTNFGLFVPTVEVKKPWDYFCGGPACDSTVKEVFDKFIVWTEVYGNPKNFRFGTRKFNGASRFRTLEDISHDLSIEKDHKF